LVFLLLELHSHDFLIGFQKLVPDVQEQAELNSRLLRGDDDLMDIVPFPYPNSAVFRSDSLICSDVL
jgi:hypothetical protein